MIGNNKGFTLIEILVVVLIFSIIMGAVTSIFASALKLQRYNLSNQQLLSQTSYVMEYMSRAIRMARKDTMMSCIDGSNYYQENTSSIEFLTYHNECWKFYLEGTRLKVDKDGQSYYLISDDFIVNSFTIDVIGDVADNDQPKVEICLEIEGDVLGDNPKIQIQTTVSQRRLDI